MFFSEQCGVRVLHVSVSNEGKKRLQGCQHERYVTSKQAILNSMQDIFSQHSGHCCRLDGCRTMCHLETKNNNSHTFSGLTGACVHIAVKVSY